MLLANAIVLRGSYIAPALVAIQLRKWQRYGHAGILLSDGRIVEALATRNAVVAEPHPCEWYNYERLLPLDHLPEKARADIAAQALTMVGSMYGWHQARDQAFKGLLSSEPDDPRREICFEVVGRSTYPYLRYGEEMHMIDAADITDAWKRSRLSPANTPPT